MTVKDCIEKLDVTDKTSIWINRDVNEMCFQIELEKLKSEYYEHGVEMLKLHPRSNQLELVLRNYKFAK